MNHEDNRRAAQSRIIVSAVHAAIIVSVDVVRLGLHNCLMVK
jgi:hypothetical protein